MSKKTLEQLWKTYPESHLHCDVTMAGHQSYRIVTSLVDRESKLIASVEHYGSGDLDDLKQEAFDHLAKELMMKMNN